LSTRLAAGTVAAYPDSMLGVCLAEGLKGVTDLDCCLGCCGGRCAGTGMGGRFARRSEPDHGAGRLIDLERAARRLSGTLGAVLVAGLVALAVTGR
jgi:hypothetical protein